MEITEQGEGVSADAQASEILLAEYSRQIEVLCQERDQLRGRVQDLVRLANEVLVNGAERAEVAEAALAEITGLLQENRLSLPELTALARSRATIDLDIVWQSFPAHLQRVVESLDQSRPSIASQSLTNLRPGSRTALEVYGLCDFIDRHTDDGEEARKVKIHERLWELSAWARAQLNRTENDIEPADCDLDTVIRELDEIAAGLTDA